MHRRPVPVRVARRNTGTKSVASSDARSHTRSVSGLTSGTRGVPEAAPSHTSRVQWPLAVLDSSTVAGAAPELCESHAPASRLPTPSEVKFRWPTTPRQTCRRGTSSAATVACADVAGQVSHAFAPLLTTFCSSELSLAKPTRRISLICSRRSIRKPRFCEAVLAQVPFSRVNYRA